MRTINGIDVFESVPEIITPSRTALLVVDMQNDECDPAGWWATQGRDVTHIGAIVPGIRLLVDAARASGALPVFIQQTTLADNASDPPAWLYFKTRDGRTRTDYNLDGSWGHAIVAALGVVSSDIVIKKHRPSGFLHTNLDLVLRSAKVESVVVCGNTSQGCVLATTLDASFHDYYTVIVEDCIQSFSQEQHENALRFMRSRYDTVTGEDVAGLWYGKGATRDA